MLLPVKLAFFQTLTADFEPFLTEFQSDKPLVPFLYTSLRELILNLLSRIVKKEILDSHTLKNVDYKKTDNLLPLKSIDLGFGTRKALAQCKKAPEIDITLFLKAVRTCIQVMVDKLWERSPLVKPLTKALTCLDPASITSKNSVAKDMMKKTLDILVDIELVDPTVADCVNREYTNLISHRSVRDRLAEYSREQTRLDHFWMNLFENSRNYENLKKIVKMLLILSHGNALLKRGFFANKQCLVENLQERSLIAQRHIYDAVTEKGGADSIKITKPMIHAVRNSNSRYKEALRDLKKVQKEEEVKDQERKLRERAIKELQIEKRELINRLETAEEEIVMKKKNFQFYDHS